MAKVLKEHISDAIFDAISLYCVENGFHDSINYPPLIEVGFVKTIVD